MLVDTLLTKYKKISEYKSPYQDPPVEEHSLLDGTLQHHQLKMECSKEVNDPFLSLSYYANKYIDWI